MASIAYEYECDRSSGFVMDPNEHKRVGYVTSFGGLGGTSIIELEFYVSQSNAVHIKALQQSTLMTTKVSGLSWWIVDYDQERKTWFEQSFPINGQISGAITGKGNPQFNVDLAPVVVKDGIDVNVYRVSLAVTPGANASYPLSFANSNLKPVVKSWGLMVGTLASSAYT